MSYSIKILLALMFVVITYANVVFLLALITQPGVYDSRVFLPFLQIISIGAVLILLALRSVKVKS